MLALFARTAFVETLGHVAEPLITPLLSKAGEVQVHVTLGPNGEDLRVTSAQYDLGFVQANVGHRGSWGISATV